jgi:hypothetical protein
MDNKHKYYEVRGPGNRFACCYTESLETARASFFDAVLSGLQTIIPFEIYEISDGEERRVQ